MPNPQEEPTHGELGRKLDAITVQLQDEAQIHVNLSNGLATLERCLVGDQTAVPPVNGLVQRHGELDERTETLEKWVASQRYWFRRLFWLGFVAVLGLFASLFWQVVVANLSQSPPP